MKRLLLALFLAPFAFSPRASFADETKSSYMHYLRGLMLEHQGAFTEAIQEYQTALSLDPQSTFLVEQTVQLALETGRSDIALDLAQRLTKLEPKSHKAFYLLGTVHWSRGEVAPAQAAFEQTLKVNPRFSEAMLALGNLLSAQSPDKAKDYFRDYLKANPEGADEAHYQIALL